MKITSNKSFSPTLRVRTSWNYEFFLFSCIPAQCSIFTVTSFVLVTKVFLHFQRLQVLKKLKKVQNIKTVLYCSSGANKRLVIWGVITPPLPPPPDSYFFYSAPPKSFCKSWRKFRTSKPFFTVHPNYLVLFKSVKVAGLLARIFSQTV